MWPPKKKEKLSREDVLKNKRQAEAARLLRIKNDPIQLVEYKEKQRLQYLRKKAKGQRKSVEEMTLREQRITRKKWKKYSSNYRQKLALNRNTNNFLRQNTPSTSDEDGPPIAEFDNARNEVGPVEDNRPIIMNKDQRMKEAKKRSQRQRKDRNKQLKEMNAVITKLKTKLNTQRQKYKGVKKKLQKVKKSVEKSPKTRIEQMSENVTKKNELIKKALFGEVMKIQLEENYAKIKSHKEKMKFKQALSGSVVEKYKLLRFKNKVVTYNIIRKNLSKSNSKNRKTQLQRLVQDFLEDDANSRLAAGKKEFISRRQIKKQKRYLLDTLKNLHKKFLKTVSFVISYALFNRLRPFWVVLPTLSNRDTCACTIHENIDLKLAALKNANILTSVSNHQSMLATLCCDQYAEKCLEKTCDNCCVNTLTYNDFDNSKPIVLKQWVNKKEAIIDLKTKKERFVTKYKKETQKILPRELISKLEFDMKNFSRHVFYIVHQYNEIKHLKESLSKNDAVVHMDFSENFCTKYNKEIQSFHFGGSRSQLSLHTVVVYLKDSVTSYCTMSSNLSHNVGAIWAHLQPVLSSFPGNIDHIHFLSDGPVTQYRNKSMFYVLGCKLLKMYSNIMRYTWNYHEAGHGKGAPDGVGATCKRTADYVIATGGDITNLEEFVAVIRERCQGILAYVIEDHEIEQMNSTINEKSSEFVAFKGTLKVHQVTGSIYFPNQLTMKSLSCFCDPDGCDHFNIGSIKYEREDKHFNCSAVFTDSEEDTLPLSTYVRNNISNPNCECNLSMLEVRAYRKTQIQNHYGSGDYVLIKYVVRRTEYRYAGVCTYVDNEDGELRITFLKICSEDGTLFKLDESDVSDVPVDQVIKKLPVPNRVIRGKRVFYQFKEKIDVFEK